MRAPDEIQSILTQRRNDQAQSMARGLEVQQAYNGDLPAATSETSENEKPPVANLVQSAVDQTAMRIGSVAPMLLFPAMRPGIKISEKRARTRRDVVNHWWTDQQMGLKIRLRARYLLAYGSSPVFIRPGLDGQPIWEVRDPLTAYPAVMSDATGTAPTDCIFSFKRTRGWLESHYPDQMQRLSKRESSVSFHVVEYVDSEQCATFVCGDANANGDDYGYSGSTPYEMMHWWPNKTGKPLVVSPSRVTLGRNLGAYDGMIGMYQAQAKTMALLILGMQRGIFPEEWVESSQPGGAEIVRYADPMTGTVGIIEGGSLKTVTVAPSQYAGVLVDRLAGEQRVDGSVPAEYGGQSTSNIRTGRRGEQVLAAAVDFYIQEAQSLLERSLEAENKLAIATVKAWAPRRTFSFECQARGTVSYTPTVDFETDRHEVRYAYAGADANGMEIRIGQSIGLETMSRRTGMEHDPLIYDVEAEMDRIRGENVEKAFMASILTMAQDPNSPVTPSDYSKFTRLVVTDKMESFEAWDKVHEDVQKRQAEAQQAAAEQAAQAQPGADIAAAARPELASVAAPSAGQGNFASLMAKLRLPQMQVPGEGAVGPPRGPA